MIELYLSNLFRDGLNFKAGREKEIKIKAEGHAGFSTNGNDIVCAAASAIIQTAVVAITRVALVRQKVKQKHGGLESIISIEKLETDKLDSLLIILNTMLAGLEELIKIYPEALRIKFK